MKVLIAEDDEMSMRVLKMALTKAGYQVDAARDGREALEKIRVGRYDALLTDWMMPHMDGIELVHAVRQEIKPAPVIMIVTALNSPDARAHALNSGGDAFLAKPYKPHELLALLGNCFERRAQPMPSEPIGPISIPASPPSFVGVGIVASTGGPPALRIVISGLNPSLNAAYLIVLHGPSWMLETFVERLRQVAPLPVHLAANGMSIEPRHIYLAPGDCHTVLDSGTNTLKLVNDPPENYVRPAADPLFRSIARTFGRHSAAVVLTGMGRDGTIGAEHISAAGGVVLAQDPESAAARSMPETVIKRGLSRQVCSLERMAGAIASEVELLATKLPPAMRR